MILENLNTEGPIRDPDIYTSLDIILLIAFKLHRHTPIGDDYDYYADYDKAIQLTVKQNTVGLEGEDQEWINTKLPIYISKDRKPE